jgi:predicted GIY-YIG superfamily endonuclease
MSSSATFFVYILRCADGSFYVGHTQNLVDGVRLHNDGCAARPPQATSEKPLHARYSRLFALSAHVF